MARSATISAEAPHGGVGNDLRRGSGKGPGLHAEEVFDLFVGEPVELEEDDAQGRARLLRFLAGEDLLDLGLGETAALDREAGRGGAEMRSENRFNGGWAANARGFSLRPPRSERRIPDRKRIVATR